MARLVIYYSVDNCGDGSAYPRLYDTEELAEWHQEHDSGDGWGESCTGDIVVEGDNLSCSELQSKEGYYLDLLFDGYDDKDRAKLVKFKDAFFPDGLPEFSVQIIGTNHYGVFVGTRLVHKVFAYPEKKAHAKGLKRTKKILELT